MEDSGLIGHIESNLGMLGSGKTWRTDEAGKALPYQIVSFRDKPIEKVTTYTTLGLSNHVMKLIDKEGHAVTEVRMELLASAYESIGSAPVVSLMMFIAEAALDRHECPWKGTVISLGAPISDSEEFRFIYCMEAGYFADDFKIYETSNPKTVFVNLVPITINEREFIQGNGSEAFNALLIAQQPDLLSFDKRPEIKLPSADARTH